MERPTILSPGSGLGTREGFTFERLSAGKNAVRQPHRARNTSRSFGRWSVIEGFNETPNQLSWAKRTFATMYGECNSTHC